MFWNKKNKENKIIKADIWFQTTDPSIDYLRYEGNYYYIKERHYQIYPTYDYTAEKVTTGVMCNVQIVEIIKIPEELVPIIRKEKYYIVNDYSVAYIAN